MVVKKINSESINIKKWNLDYDKQQWELHNHLLEIGKCDNDCDDWLECSEDWKSDKEWMNYFSKRDDGKWDNWCE